MSDSRAILCTLILMRLKTELSHFDRLRLHKAALMLNVFSCRDCFDIDDEAQDYYPTVDKLASEIKKLQTETGADTASTLQAQLNSCDVRITEAYKRSISYVIQSAGFVNSITDNDTLILISNIIGIVHQCNGANVSDIEAQLNSKGYTLDRKSIVSAVVNLDKTGVLIKTDAGYCLAESLNGVSEYVKLI